MWTHLVVLLVAAASVEISICAPGTDINIRLTRQLDFGDAKKCCPCSETNPSSQSAIQKVERELEASEEDSEEEPIPEESSKADMIVEPEVKQLRPSAKGCTCGLGDDMDTDSSTVVKVLRNGPNDCLGSVPPPDPKPLFRPEVGFASSVLETLKAANEEELREARSRAATRSADSALSSTRKVPSTFKASERTATISLKKKPTLTKPNSIPGSGMRSREVSAKIGNFKKADSSVGSSDISSKTTYLPTGKRLLGSPNMSDLSFSRGSNIRPSFSFRNMPIKTGPIKESSFGPVTSSNSFPRRPLGLSTVQKLSAPAPVLTSSKVAINKPKSAIGARTGLLRAPKVTSGAGKLKLGSIFDKDMAISASTDKFNRLSGKTTKFKLAAEAAKPKLPLGNALFSKASTAAGKKEQLLKNSAPNLPRAGLSGVDPLQIGGDVIARLEKIRETMMKALLGTPLIKDDIVNIKNAEKSSDSEDITDTKPKQLSDMDSASSNVESLAKLPGLTARTSNLGNELIVQPDELIDSTTASTVVQKSSSSAIAPMKAVKIPKLVVNRKPILRITTPNPLSIKPKTAPGSVKSDLLKHPEDNTDEGTDPVAVAVTQPENSKTKKEDDCTRCNDKSLAEPIVAEKDKVYSCKLVCKESNA